MIALGFTLGRVIDSMVMLRWVELLRSGYHWPGPVVNARSAYTVQARNICIDDFLAHPDYEKCEALLYWDSDQLPPVLIPHKDGTFRYFTEHLDLMLERNPEKMVMAGLYFSRNSEFKRTPDGKLFEEYPHEPVAYERTEEDGVPGYKYLSIPRMVNEILRDRTLHQVGAVGTGAMLIRKQVFEELLTLKAPEHVFEAPKTPGGLAGRQWTEDLYFCEEVTQKLGYPIWLDSAAESGHQGDNIWVASKHYLTGRGMLPASYRPPTQSDEARLSAAFEKRKNRRERRLGGLVGNRPGAQGGDQADDQGGDQGLGVDAAADHLA